MPHRHKNVIFVLLYIICIVKYLGSNKVVLILGWDHLGKCVKGWNFHKCVRMMGILPNMCGGWGF